MSATKSMFKLRRPCAKCPFRCDIDGYLRQDRAREIAREVAGGSIFHCHETTVYVEEEAGDGGDMEPGPDSQFCAGALILMEKADAPNQAMRMAERIGLYDRARLDMDVPVHESFQAFIRHHNEGQEGETVWEAEPCSVSNYGCEAPAGYMVGGHAIDADPDEAGEVHDCPSCGESVCDSCSDDNGVCVYCAGEDE